MSNIVVSIHCLAYNHENYIRDAIEGFLSQKTNFKYEVLIHDDASTDRTPEIIKEYAMKYPEIIKPMFQTENQYSKGIKVGLINQRRATGKYIAVCEGDDFWINPNKLQKQVDYMESNPDCSLCFHDALLVDENKDVLGPFPGDYERESGIKNINELTFIPTASKMFRREIVDLLPDWYFKAPFGDFAHMLTCSNFGHIYYMNEKMSCYRTNVPVSILFHERKAIKKNPRLRIERSLARIKELESYNEWSNKKNDKYVQELILMEELRIATWERNFKEVRSGKYKVLFDKMGLKRKIKFTAEWILPNNIYNLLNDIRRYVEKNFLLKKKRKISDEI